MGDNSRGDSNRITREYFDSILVEQRLVGAERAQTEWEIWGRRYQTPLMSAAFSHLGRQADGQSAAVALAEGMRDAGALNWWGMSDAQEVQEILATGADTVEIIKPYADESLIARAMENAITHGAVAVGMDIDHCFGRDGRYDNVMGYEMRPKSAEQLRSYVKRAGATPFVVKGVLSVRDAERCAEIGASAIVISHHHGIMDYAVPPLRLLPQIRRAVGSQLHIFVDCGVSSAMDAFKALALGAEAVCVSREILPVLKAGGKEAVTARMREMTGQLSAIMARTGARSLGEIDSEVLWGAEKEA